MTEFIKRYSVVMASGALMAAAFPSMGLWVVAWGGLVPLLYATHANSPGDSAAKFMLAGWIFHLMVFSWLGGNVHWAGGWALLGWLGLSAYMALYWAAIGALWPWLNRHTPWPIACFIFVGLWIGIEYIQATLFTGFGWSALAYSQGPFHRFAQWATLGGIGLIAGVVILFNTFIAQAAIQKSRRWLPALCALALLGIATFGGGALLDESEPSGKRVGIVQSSFPQIMKWDPEYTVEMVQNTAEKSRLLVDRAGADVILWPEALVMRDPQGDIVLEEIIGDLARDTNTHLIIGSVRDDAATGASYNSSFHVAPDGIISADASYDKIHLAPFGEYIPLESFIPFLRDIVPAIGDVDRGEDYNLFHVDETAVGPLICFEVLFPSMAMHLRSEGADALAVVTNLGWFGASAAQGQELEMARFRAIESRLPLIHAANTGISGVFDPYGRFQPVNMWQSSSGQVRAFKDIPPAQAANFRMFGAFDLAQRAPHPFPLGPVWFSPVVLLASLIAVAAIAVRARKTAHE